MALLQAVSQALPYGGSPDYFICRSAAFHGQMYCCSRAHPAQYWKRYSFEVSSSGRFSNFTTAAVLPTRPPASQPSCSPPSVSLLLTLTELELDSSQQF